MNENNHKSCHSSSKNILIEHSTVQWLPSQPVTAVCCFVLDCSFDVQSTQWNAMAIATALRQTTRLANKIIFNGKSRKLEVWQVSCPDASKKQCCNSELLSVVDRSVTEFGQFFFFQFSNSLVLPLFAGNLNVWKRVISLLSLNTTVVFCKTRFSSHHSVCLLTYSYS